MLVQYITNLLFFSDLSRILEFATEFATLLQNRLINLKLLKIQNIFLLRSHQIKVFTSDLNKLDFLANRLLFSTINPIIRIRYTLIRLLLLGFRIEIRIDFRFRFYNLNTTERIMFLVDFISGDFGTSSIHFLNESPTYARYTDIIDIFFQIIK